MKVLTPILTVFIAINLITANTISAQDLTEEQPRKVQDTLVQKQQEVALKQADLARKAADMAAKEAQMQADVAEQVRRLSLLSLPQAKQGTDRVLLVLTDPLKPRDVAATTEDLNIMSRIFDKKLGPPYESALGEIRTGRLSSANVGNVFSALTSRNASKATQAIYLHGYAALFLMNVDFPLSPLPKVKADKAQEDADPLWEITKQEISTSGKTGAEDYFYVKYDSDFGQISRAAKEYDAEKVEDLKTNLTKALRHAANIRNLKPDESIILAVAGAQSAQGGLQQVAVKDNKTYRVIASNADMGPLFGAAPALLTIRAKKSDIDAYAKDQLDLDKFRERVQFLTSYFNLGPARAEQIQWRAPY